MALAAVLLVACGTEAGPGLARAGDVVPAAGPGATPTPDPIAPSDTTSPDTTAPPDTTPSGATGSPDASGGGDAATSTTRPPIPRVVVETGFSPMATVGPVVLHHPAAQVERIGFHESGHDGARQLDPVAAAARPFTMETRERGTGDRTAADVVVPPGAEIRAPVTGRVLRAGGYVLYCEHADDFAVIEPDARPGWEVKVLHIDGVAVRAGDRVEAGVTLLAPAATVLPFASQVDEDTAEPSWPHVHVEVVDPSIPDRPSPGGGC